MFDLVAVHSNGTIEQRHGLQAPWMIGRMIARLFEPYLMGGTGARLAAEDVYVGKNPRGAVELAKFSGALVAHVEPAAKRQALWVTAGSWRKHAFRRGWWASQAAAAGMTHSKKLATGAMPWMPKRDAAKLESLMTVPLIVPGLRELLDRTGQADQDHATDAGGVFHWLQKQ